MLIAIALNRQSQLNVWAKMSADYLKLQHESIAIIPFVTK
jgi:hypothetical protein